ncbi:connector enhancer of kinase suppressor of ras [Tetranychus urticae]|uniref:PDZ domain-containing protein n=1 Tax=Tetranychus urticae TaxID=32264 RepID=T1L2K6_TETUR|nr:connector enhancer of kinase suppressor of ras [Tetranychus urticae]
MAFINVAEWTPQNVVSWLQGLEDSILPYVAFFLNNNINGCRLLLLSCDDLENLNVTKVGHQEIILEAVELLKHLHYNFCSETLQMLSLRLGCKARSLFNILKRETDEEEKYRDRVTTKTLSGVCDILTSVKLFVSWIDRYPFGGQEEYISIRKEILKLSIELASTAQRDQFVEKPNEVIKENCAIFAETCDKIVQDLNDPLAIQPAYLEVITIKKKNGEDIFSGVHFSSSYSGIHIVERIERSSIFYRGRIEEGDEIVQINYQTVVGWHLKKMLNVIKEFSTEIAITLKKRPLHSNQITVLKQFKIVNRKLKSGSRYRNASTTTGHSDNDSDNGSIKERSTVPENPINTIIQPRRPRIVRRRSSISGSSPTAKNPPTRIEDVYNRRDMILSRTVSHDDGKNSLISGKSKISPGTSCESCCSKNSGNSIPPRKSLSSSQVPYAKVHPLLNRESNFFIPKPPSPHYVTPPPLPPQPKHLIQQHQQTQQQTQQQPSQQKTQQQQSQSSQVNQSQNVQRSQNQQPKIKSTIKLTSYDMENDPEFHEYQPPPSPKLPPSPPKTPTSTKSVPPPAPAPRQRVIDDLLRNVTLPRRKSIEGNNDGPKPFTNKNNSSTNITNRPQPPLPRVIGVARSTQPFNRDNKSQQLSSYSDSSADSLKSIESDGGDASNDRQKTKPAIPPKSHRIQSRSIFDQ